jgi:hypothetical protein
MEAEMFNLVSCAEAQSRRGLRRSQFYVEISSGVYVPPIKDGNRNKFLEYEVDAINRAIAAGWDIERRRALVKELIGKRKLDISPAALADRADI